MPENSRAYGGHLAEAAGLVTPYANTRAGFVQMALERNNRAAPYIAEARDLNAKAQEAKVPSELLNIAGIHGALLTAAGISDKAAGHIDEVGQKEAIKGLIQTYLDPAGSSFREELVYRFLLTRGDTLGGSMRNVVGALAQRRFTSMLLARLRNAGTPFYYCVSGSTTWVPHTTEPSTAVLETIKSMSWENRLGGRVLSYNLKVPVVNKSVDMNLLNCLPNNFSKAVLADPSRFIALGELKGGIDPAGADEHWKTANSALDRIRKAFTTHGKKPALFFVGAAIEQAMAQEIWNHLQDGSLTNAANLTVDEHLTALCEWLVAV